MVPGSNSTSPHWLVIGGAGLLGSHVARHLSEQGAVVDILDIRQPDILPGPGRLAHVFDVGDLELLRRLLRRRQPETACWCLDMALQPGSTAPAEAQYARNLARLRAVLPVLAESGVRTLVFSAAPELLTTQRETLDALRHLAIGLGLRIHVVICGNLQGGLFSCPRDADARAGIFDDLLGVLLGQRFFINVPGRAALDEIHELLDVADVARLLVAQAGAASVPGLTLARTGEGAALPLAGWIAVAEQKSERRVSCHFQRDLPAAEPAVSSHDDEIVVLPMQIRDPLLLLQRSLRRLRHARRDQYSSVLDELQRRFPSAGLKWHSASGLKAWWKRRAWRAAISSAVLLKRLLDVAVALAALVALSPLLLASAAIIKLQDGGPVLFWQMRVGRHGREFPFPKFRSMVVDAEARRAALLEKSHHQGTGSDITFKMKRDPRITAFGRFIRKLSIDELPQLWCVLTGEMSLVGPRPPLPVEVARYTLSDRRRLHVKPGLTCIWQVNGRGDIAFAEQVELDKQYIDSQSLWLDIKLLFKTVPAVLIGKGAY